MTMSTPMWSITIHQRTPSGMHCLTSPEMFSPRVYLDKAIQDALDRLDLSDNTNGEYQITITKTED